MAAQSIVGEKSLAFAKRIAKCFVFPSPHIISFPYHSALFNYINYIE